MSSYQFTLQAIEDLFEIWSYIAGDDLEAASRVEEAIHAGCAFLADTPLAGRIREDLTSLPLRFWLVQPYRNYWIVYRPKDKTAAGHSDHSHGTKYSADIELGQGKSPFKIARTNRAPFDEPANSCPFGLNRFCRRPRWKTSLSNR